MARHWQHDYLAEKRGDAGDIPNVAVVETVVSKGLTVRLLNRR